MPAPRRQADLGTVGSVVDDLLLARDAGGIQLAGADRLAATMALRGVGAEPTAQQVADCRDFLRVHVERSSTAYAAVHRGEPVETAAVDSVVAILLQPATATRTATAIRREALQRYGCAIQPDSLRKRELPILQAIAEAVYDELTQSSRGDGEVSVLQLLTLLKPYAEMADTAVSYATDLLMRRAALDDDSLVDQGIGYAIWAVAQLGVLPVYGMQRLEMVGATDMAHNALGYLLHAMITVPFQRDPDDIQQLATAVRVGEDPQPFYERLLATPLMRPVVQRFVEWLAEHQPKKCQVDSNDVMVGYCGPHYYAAICESLADATADWASGAFQEEMSRGAETLLSVGQRHGAELERQLSVRLGQRLEQP
jgi:hypothetical protein